MEISDSRGLWVRLVRSRKASPALAVARTCLVPVAWLYGKLVETRRSAYRRGRFTSERVGVPVISVGNLTAGGVGKTPMVEWIARWCIQNGRRPAIISRGYGAARHSPRNDEALLLQQNLPQVPHCINPDRIAAAREALASGADCLILDDGFQHLRIRRDLNLVLVDSLDPFGGGRVLPAGALREPLTCLCDADAVVITRADALGSVALQHLRRRLRELMPQKPILEAAHRPVRLLMPHGPEAERLEWLRGKRAFLFCGIGNPEGFVHTVRNLDVEIVAGRFLPDHFIYRLRDLTALAGECVRFRVDCALTTQKDAVKIGPAWPGVIPLRAIKVEMEFTSGLETFRKILKDVLSG